ncbi:serine dehydratase-like isoform X1 [Genypterus blacodes]|uniref:serine dehydratase-like isoform X1 n=1 Tax=Genypterus blacodes TaxID=154954 RepID=UPI003F77134E
MSEHFHLNTPLLESAGMSKRVGTTVYLKMESSQPTGSFKIRGIGHLCQQLASKSKGVTCASGGSAGLAASFVARKMCLPATIVIPTSSPQLVVQKLQDQGATVKITGKVWDDANTEALRLTEIEGLTYIPAFDHPLLWQGHASVITEVAASLGPTVKPGAVVLSVGGGGLLCGVVQGLIQAGWADVPIVAVETVGADCFNAAVKAGKVVTLDDITRSEDLSFLEYVKVFSANIFTSVRPSSLSEAKCLGSKTVCTKAFEHSQSSELNIISEVVTDLQALHAVETFLDEERVLVQLACGAALAAVYSGVILRLQEEGRLPTPLRPLLVIVCGGCGIDMKQLAKLREKIHT